jgi:hypothetical protein
MATWQMQRFMIPSILDLVGDRRDSPVRALQGGFGTLRVPWKGAMIKTILITGTIGMIVGFGGTLMSLFGGGSLLMEYLEFVVMLVLFLVMLIGAYWFVMVNPSKEVKKPAP